MSDSRSTSVDEYLASLPPERVVPGARAGIRASVERGGSKVVVLDDDPTGVQSVHGVPVLTSWGKDDLIDALRGPGPVFYILTNTRSLPEDEAVGMNVEISKNLCEAAMETGVDFEVVSRSDSTLRGHYPAETDALTRVLSENGRGPDAVIICPAFFEAGRFTSGDTHFVVEGDELTPTGETEFARDHSFGYRSSDLKDWVEEKTGGRVPASEVVAVGLEDLRGGGPERVRETLDGASDGATVVLNAVTYADLDVFVLGLLEAISGGKRFLYRTGPSFVRARGGITKPELVRGEDLRREGHGLVLVGSYVNMTTRQLEEALKLDGLRAVEMSVKDLISPDTKEREAELERVVRGVNSSLASEDVVVFTSRELVTSEGSGGLTNFEIGVSVSDALVEVVRRLDREVPLSFVIAKGGITSSDIATKGLGVRRAEVAGPLLPPGIVPVWMLPEDNDFPGLPYVIFPGNVGGPQSLREAIEILRGTENTGGRAWRRT